MNTRHRAANFASPFTLPELELDPEKALWVPGKKKIFIPAVKPEPAAWWIDEGWMPYEETRRFMLRQMEEMTQRMIFSNYNICVPGRADAFTGVVSHQGTNTITVPITYNNIVRSTNIDFVTGRWAEMRW